ncbi:uncharacterized protein LOC129779401 [Toxorhynchites rutilus septentrionalis]|uniref:uncharacterized protein LOC129779401 n=1 Tax=Toxorhynchites rutilus septentrionalis TaxID=329112 RepID=UPI0024789625|nr:uncharacterized protein LOC129779401 [Toxorhynchites rutilus septentrionalis]
MIKSIMGRVKRETSFMSILQLISGSLVVLLLGRSYGSDDHLCIRYESYTELETVPRNQTVQVLTREWCLEIPPRCTSYRPEIKEVYVKLNVTKTRKIEYCCDGFEEYSQENLADSGTSPLKRTCRPICRGGCGRGSCVSPNMCSCEAGFTGKHCIQRCRNGTWGENCKNRCYCQNFSLCDSKTGHCRCSDGWIGNHCESPCPAKHYGTLCKNRCDCNTTRCDHITGKCLADDDHVMFDNITRTLESNFSGESTERISAEQWIKVESTTGSVVASTTTKTGINSSLPINSTQYAESYKEYIPSNANVSMVPIHLLTSTTEAARNETFYEILTSTSRVEITFIDSSVNKIEHHLIESSTLADSSTALVYLASENQPDLVEFVDEKESSNGEENTGEEEVNNKQAIVTISCLLLTLVLLLSVVAYMKNLNRKALKKQQQQPSSSKPNTNGPDSPRILDPLPDLPRVLYTKVRAKNQRNGNAPLEHYDVPANNTSVNKSSPFNYNFTSTTGKPSQSPPRKYSLEHIYDEIQYPPFSTEMGGPTEGSIYKSIMSDAKMTPVKVIDEVKGKQ